MKKPIQTLILIAVIIVGGWLLYHREQIESPSDALSLAGSKLKAWSASWSSSTRSPNWNGNDTTTAPFAIQPQGQETIRVASFKMGPAAEFDSTFNSPPLAADIVRKFDLIAIQTDGLRLDYLEEVTQLASFGHRQYDLVKGPINGSQQFAFLFDRATIEMDRAKWYLVKDPNRIFGNAPMVGWFRSKLARPEEAFTFSMANVSLSEGAPDRELIHLGSLFRAIRADGRGEDDILIAGDFSTSARGLEPIRRQNGFIWAIDNQPTNVQNTQQFDNIVFNQRATVEYHGQSDVVDFLRIYNLRMAEAFSISEHMPVWADFSIYEGRGPGRYAQAERSEPSASE